MKVLIVDDHAMVREGLAVLLRQAQTGISIFLAGECEEGLKIAEAHRDLDAVILDLMMPDMSGVAALREFAKRCPEVPVIVLSSSEDPQDVRRAIGSGALGYVPKTASPQTLIAALNFVLAGNVYVPPLLIGEGRPNADACCTAASLEASRLTQRQIEVLRLLCGGQTNKEIGVALSLSEKTVKAHVTAIFKALNVVNRTQAAAAARRAGLI